MTIALAPLNVKALTELELDVFRTLCDDVGTLEASIYMQQISNDPRSYLGQGAPYISDGECSRFVGNYLLSQVMRKNPRLPTGYDLAAVATRKFWQAEEKNALTNRRFATVDPADERVVPVQRALEYILGALTRTDIEFLYSRLAVTGKSDTQLTYDEAYPEEKFRDAWGVSPRLAHVARAFPAETAERDYVQKLQTVPKDSRSDRCILKQCRGNLALQRATGQLLRSRVNTRTALRLNDQTRNQHLAQRAWRDGLATIDLSSASDTIALRVVSKLFDTDILRPWLHLLQLGRLDTVEKVLDDGSRVVKPLEMWSAMGNGYTWELESLMFYAITVSVTGAGWVKDIGIYGDDIIVPGRFYPAAVEALQFFGFSVNMEKSFWHSDFRESCGADFVRGVACRPFYLRSEYSTTRPRASYVLEWVNLIREYHGRTGLELRRTLQFLHVLLEEWGFNPLLFAAPAVSGNVLGQYLVYPHEVALLRWIHTKVCYRYGLKGFTTRCLSSDLVANPMDEEMTLRRVLFQLHVDSVVPCEAIVTHGRFRRHTDILRFVRQTERSAAYDNSHTRPLRGVVNDWTQGRCFSVFD